MGQFTETFSVDTAYVVFTSEQSESLPQYSVYFATKSGLFFIGNTQQTTVFVKQRRIDRVEEIFMLK
jgi:hypothetical protein